jgi:hypothetical protein
MSSDRRVDPAWERWVAENLLRGAEADTLTAELIREGVTPNEAATIVRAVATSPILEAALPFARESRRLRTFARLDGARWRGAAHPTTVERIKWPGLDVLLDRYWATGAPVVIEGLVSEWPAMKRWSLASLAERFGDVEVAITDGRSADPDYDMNHERHTRNVTLRDLVERISREPESNDFYMVANNRNVFGPLSALLEDVVWPDGLVRKSPVEGGTCEAVPSSAIWIGPGGTVTPLHHDTSNILFCQVVGRKRFKLIAPLEIAVLDGARAMYAAVDPDAPDLERFPWWPDVLVREVTLEPGEALFLPVGVWHHVRSLEPSVSLALNGFDCPNEFDWFVPARD